MDQPFLSIFFILSTQSELQLFIEITNDSQSAEHCTKERKKSEIRHCSKSCKHKHTRRAPQKFMANQRILTHEARGGGGRANKQKLIAYFIVRDEREVRRVDWIKESIKKADTDEPPPRSTLSISRRASLLHSTFSFNKKNLINWGRILFFCVHQF